MVEMGAFHVECCVQVLEQMQEVESVTEHDPDSKRPDEHLLVTRHVGDVVPPEVYLGNDVEFVDFVQGRANVGSLPTCCIWT